MKPHIEILYNKRRKNSFLLKVCDVTFSYVQTCKLENQLKQTRFENLATALLIKALRRLLQAFCIYIEI